MDILSNFKVSSGQSNSFDDMIIIMIIINTQVSLIYSSFKLGKPMLTIKRIWYQQDQYKNYLYNIKDLKNILQNCTKKQTNIFKQLHSSNKYLTYSKSWKREVSLLNAVVSVHQSYKIYKNLERRVNSQNRRKLQKNWKSMSIEKRTNTNNNNKIKILTEENEQELEEIVKYNYLKVDRTNTGEYMSEIQKRIQRK